MFVCLKLWKKHRYFLKKKRTFNRKYPITVSQLHFGQRLTFLSPFCMPFLDLTCFETLWLFSYFTFWRKVEGFYTYLYMVQNDLKLLNLIKAVYINYKSTMPLIFISSCLIFSRYIPWLKSFIHLISKYSTFTLYHILQFI